MSVDATTSVLVPTWRRPDVLLRCLRALAAQTCRPSQVVVTVRRDDAVTWDALAHFDGRSIGLHPVAVEAGPVTAAMSAGLRETAGAFVAITDDDAEPRPDWVERIVGHFADARVGGVGGRDWQAQTTPHRRRVGRIGWAGRPTGNHHLGVGPARQVDVLKGVNCAFRGEPLRRIGFDPRLWGVGTVIHWEMSLCFAFAKAGWQLVYDPLVAVDHRVAPRHDIDQRERFVAAAHRNVVHNETLSLLEFLPPVRRTAFVAWATAIGTGDSPGVAQLPRLVTRRSPWVASRWWATLNGRVAGVRTWLAGTPSGVQKPRVGQDAADQRPAST